MCDLRDRGVTYVDTPEVAAAELELARRTLHHRLDDLARIIGRDDVATLDTAVMNVESAIMAVATTRLMAAIVAVNGADVGVFVAPGKVSS